MIGESCPVDKRNYPRYRLFVNPTDWSNWRWQLKNATSKETIAREVALTEEERVGLARARFPVAVTPYYFSLVDRKNPDCPIRKQVIPTSSELDTAPGELLDPLGEDRLRPTRAVIHKYPDRVLLLVIDRCAVYCRHCNRRRLVGGEHAIAQGELDEAIAYIAGNRRIHDVLISGGDPLILATERLEHILGRLRAIEHVEIIRIGTRVPVVLPMRIDDALLAALRRYHPLFVNTHFNHAKEVTPESRAACERLVDAGIPVGNQAVLLRGINSSVKSMRRLSRELLKMRVKPYYLFQGDPAEGTDHLRIPVEKAIEIMAGMRGWMSGMAIPHLVIDAPGGGGKVPIGPEYLVEVGPESAIVRSFRGELIKYPQPRKFDTAVPYDSVFFQDDDDEQ